MPDSEYNPARARGQSPAFPRPDERDPATGEGIREGADGMSLREYIAIKAMTGLLAAPDTNTMSPEELVRGSVHYADLLLEELNK